MARKKSSSIDMVNDPAARYYQANRGITKSAFMEIVKMTGLSFSSFSKLMPVSKRTLEKMRDHELMSPMVSDKVLQIATLYHLGESTFNNIISFRKWLQTPLLTLGNKKPIDFIDNDTGITMIRDLLGRIEYSVYS